VIPRSWRVRELPPPPRIRGETGQGRAVLPVEPVEPPAPIELADFELSPPQARRRRPAALPEPWRHWLCAPERRKAIGYGGSCLVHLAVILLLAVCYGYGQRHAVEPILASSAGPWSEVPCEGPWIVPPRLALASARPLSRPVAPAGPEGNAADIPQKSGPSPSALPADAKKAAPADAGPAAKGDAAQGDPAGGTPMPGLGKFRRRSPSGRSEAVRYGGGTPRSEVAVEHALRWLVAHQRPDGSWNFNHTTDGCMHYCTHPGSEASTTAATGLALLPFLGAGYTHLDGEYQDVVQRALEYLLNRGLPLSYGNDLRDGSMYGQGLATIALCEAYGMTHDPALKAPAQGGLDFIAYAQDHNGGGWRYSPGAPGDTTVTGWMIMALKSGQMAGLSFSTPAVFLAEKFLDGVQNEDGSQYGYMTRKPGPTTTAIALLCRMYGGWPHETPGLVKGVGQLETWGPSADSLYYNYYATQVMFHWGGAAWNTWNSRMRDSLIAAQDGGGHAAGSWYFSGNHGEAGGRLYSTAMAAMILEVYYRHMPLYSEEAVQRKF
jgi:hypothetical protein